MTTYPSSSTPSMIDHIKWTEVLQPHRHSITHYASDKKQGQKGEQEGQCKLAHSPASDVEKGHTSRRALTGDVQEGVFEDWHLRSGSIGARALNPITAGPLPATLLGPLASHSNHQQTHCTSARK